MFTCRVWAFQDNMLERLCPERDMTTTTPFYIVHYTFLFTFSSYLPSFISVIPPIRHFFKIYFVPHICHTYLLFPSYLLLYMLAILSIPCVSHTSHPIGHACHPPCSSSHVCYLPIYLQYLLFTMSVISTILHVCHTSHPQCCTPYQSCL